MAVIFAFFLKLIELHVTEFRNCERNNTIKANAHGRVVQVVLLTLTGFVEWVSITHVMTQNGRLLQILCLLLNDDTAFRGAAAECLLQVNFSLALIVFVCNVSELINLVLIPVHKWKNRKRLSF